MNQNQLSSQIVIRSEIEEDYLKTEEMAMRAFWNLHGPGCDEHLLVHNLRRDASYIPEISRVAVLGDSVIGTIMYAEAKVILTSNESQERSEELSENTTSSEAVIQPASQPDGGSQTEKALDLQPEKIMKVLTFGPLCVEPAYQDTGVGGRLLEETLVLAREAGYTAIIILGEPEYYPKHGFITCDHYGITTADGKYFDSFMALELIPGALEGVHGRFFEPEVYENLPKDEVERLGNLFPPIRKMKFPGQWEYEDATQEKDGYTLVSALLYKPAFARIYEEYLNELALTGKWIEDALKNDPLFLTEEMGQYFAVPEKKPYVILDADCVVGIVVLSVPQADEGQEGCDYYIEELYLIPEYRRKGIASDIVSRYWRQAEGICGLCVFRQNKTAITFWEKMIAESHRQSTRLDIGNDMWMYCIE